MDELDKIKKKKMEELTGKVERKNNSPSVPVIISDASFKSIIKLYPLLVVDCWATWCAPCKKIEPIIDELAMNYKGEAVFGKLNVDENPTVSEGFGIRSIPTLLFFKNGKLVDRIVGAVPKNQIETKLRYYF